MHGRNRSGYRAKGMMAAVALAAFFAAAPAHAGDREAADRLFEEALALSDAGNWDAACPKFKESNEADPSVGALLNMATCSERVGDLLLAKQQYGEAATRNESTEDPVRRDAVKQQLASALAALDLRTPRILVAAQPAGARISVDGAATAADAQGTAVAVGKHVVRIEADGYVSQEKSVEVIEKQRLRLEIALLPKPQEKPQPIPPPPSESGPDLVVPGIVVGALGLAIVGAGGGLLGVASSKASQISELCGDDPEPPACFGNEAAAAEATELSESGRPMEIAGGVLVGVGGATLVTGVILLALSGSQGEEARAGVSFTPVLGPDTVGWSFAARF